MFRKKSMVGAQELLSSNSFLNHSKSKVHENNQTVANPRLLTDVHVNVAFFIVLVQ